MYLLLFSGLGDRDWLLRWAAIVWRLRGFKSIVWPLAWEMDLDGHADFDARLQAILDWLDRLPAGEQVCIIGNSAGGVVAALVTLRRSWRVKRAIAVSSPLNRQRMGRNRLLDVALSRLQSQLQGTSIENRNHLASFQGRQDGIVLPHYSELAGVMNAVLPTSGHAFTIAMAHTVFSGRLAAWLRGA